MKKNSTTMTRSIKALKVALLQYDNHVDGQCGPHPDFEVMERTRVAFDDVNNDFNGKGIEPELVLWGMVRAMLDFIQNHRLIPLSRGKSPCS